MSLIVRSFLGCRSLVFVSRPLLLPGDVSRALPFLDSDHSDLGCPLLPCATRLCPTESSASAYGKLRFCLRKAPLLPYGKLRFCLRKAPLLPTESSASAYGELRHSLHFLIVPVNKPVFLQLNPPGSRL